MRLVLVTGAGASRRLGIDDSPLPLMADWSDALCAALNAKEADLAAACHLKTGMGGEEFEKNLGLLLRWEQVRHLNERFEGLGSRRIGARESRVADARTRMDHRMGIVRNRQCDPLRPVRTKARRRC